MKKRSIDFLLHFTLGFGFVFALSLVFPLWFASLVVIIGAFIYELLQHPGEQAWPWNDARLLDWLLWLIGVGLAVCLLLMDAI